MAHRRLTGIAKPAQGATAEERIALRDVRRQARVYAHGPGCRTMHDRQFDRHAHNIAATFYTVRRRR